MRSKIEARMPTPKPILIEDQNTELDRSNLLWALYSEIYFEMAIGRPRVAKTFNVAKKAMTVAAKPTSFGGMILATTNQKNAPIAEVRRRSTTRYTEPETTFSKSLLSKPSWLPLHAWGDLSFASVHHFPIQPSMNTWGGEAIVRIRRS